MGLIQIPRESLISDVTAFVIPASKKKLNLLYVPIILQDKREVLIPFPADNLEWMPRVMTRIAGNVLLSKKENSAYMCRTDFACGRLKPTDNDSLGEFFKLPDMRLAEENERSVLPWVTKQEGTHHAVLEGDAPLYSPYLDELSDDDWKFLSTPWVNPRNTVSSFFKSLHEKQFTLPWETNEAYDDPALETQTDFPEFVYTDLIKYVTMQ